MQTIVREKHYWNEHEDFNWLSDRSKRDIVALLPPLDGDVLELCIGSGMLTEHIPKTYTSYTGLDLSRTLLTTLRRKMPTIALVQGNAEEPCFASASFDTVIVFAGLHHLPHFDASIRQAYRLLRPGGRFLCLEPNNGAWYRKPMSPLKNIIGLYSDDEVWLDPKKVASALRAAGYIEIREDYVTPRFRPSFLTATNKVLAQMMYAAAALGSSRFTQSFFFMSATKA